MVDNYISENKYRLGGLEHVLYLYPFSDNALLIQDNMASGIDNTILSAVTVNSLSLEVEESLENRYSFEATLSATINEVDNKLFYDLLEELITKKFILFFKDNNGNKWVMNPKAPAHASYSYVLNDDSIGNACNIDFSVISNQPVLSYDGDLNAEWLINHGCKDYNIGKITRLQLVDVNNARVIHNFRNSYTIMARPNSIKTIEFSKGSLELLDEYEDDLFKQTLSFSIPFENYQSAFHYDLLSFQDNRYIALLGTTNGNHILLGFRRGLLPSYTISTSDNKSGLNSISIALETQYTEWSTLVNEFPYEVEELPDVYYKPVDTECMNNKVIVTLIEEFDNKTKQSTNNFYCLQGKEETYSSYNIVDYYTFFSNGFGFPIITETCNDNVREEVLCKTSGLPTAIYLVSGLTETAEFDVASECPISFSSSGSITQTFSNGKLTVSMSGVGEGVLNVSINNGEFLRQINVYCSATRINMVQDIYLNKNGQTVNVVLNQPLSNIDTMRNPNTIFITRKGSNSLDIRVKENASSDSVIYNIVITYRNRMVETIRVHQSANELSEKDEQDVQDKVDVTSELSYRWIKTEQTYCLEDNNDFNCISAYTSSDEYLCYNDKKYKVVKHYIDEYCDGDWKYIGDTLGEEISDTSGDCRKANVKGEVDFSVDLWAEEPEMVDNSVRVLIKTTNGAIREDFYSDGAIARQTYRSNSNIKEVEFGNNITVIGIINFNQCSNLEKVTLPDNVRTIGASSFAICSKLSTIVYKGKTYTDYEEIRSALDNNNVTYDGSTFLSGTIFWGGED